ncbi:hypothetical protein V8C86DRAFT_3088155 [Haematococcus lacustris]
MSRPGAPGAGWKLRSRSEAVLVVVAEAVLVVVVVVVVVGATKRSLSQLGSSLQAELQQASVRNVAVHNLSPGMVTTELLMTGADTPTSRFFINCLAEEAGDVARFLVPRIRRVPLDSVNPLTGAISPAYIKYLTKGKAYSQILKRLVLGERKDRFVKE